MILLLLLLLGSFVLVERVGAIDIIEFVEGMLEIQKSIV